MHCKKLLRRQCYRKMNDGKLYANYNQSQRFDAKCALDEFSHYFNWCNDGSDKLLDIGCGPGDVLNDFVVPKVPENFEKIVGVDISNDMVNYARRSLKLKSVEFHRLDIADDLGKCQKVFGGKDVQFDNITSFYCQHWIQDQRSKLLQDFLTVKLKIKFQKIDEKHFQPAETGWNRFDGFSDQLPNL